MFGIGETELILILAFGFIIIGPEKLPGMGRTIGRVLKQFKDAQEGFTNVVQTEIMDPAQEAFKATDNKQASGRREALLDDADIDATLDTSLPDQGKETFQQRRERLAREKEAAASAVPAAASSIASPAAAPATDASVATDASAQSSDPIGSTLVSSATANSASASSVTPVSQEETNHQVSSARDLYNLKPRITHQSTKHETTPIKRGSARTAETAAQAAKVESAGSEPQATDVKTTSTHVKEDRALS